MVFTSNPVLQAVNHAYTVPGHALYGVLQCVGLVIHVNHAYIVPGHAMYGVLQCVGLVIHVNHAYIVPDAWLYHNGVSVWVICVPRYRHGTQRIRIAGTETVAFPLFEVSPPSTNDLHCILTYAAIASHSLAFSRILSLSRLFSGSRFPRSFSARFLARSLAQVLDGKTSPDYIQRVEPSSQVSLAAHPPQSQPDTLYALLSLLVEMGDCLLCGVSIEAGDGVGLVTVANDP